MRLSMASTMTQVVSTCDEGLVRERAGGYGAGGIGLPPKQTNNCPRYKHEGWAMSVLKGDHHASPSHQVQGRLRHRGLLSAMQRDLFKVSRHSFGHPVIGSCLHIKHRSVLASRRNSASDVPGWNSMLDGVRGTHCATPKKEGEEEEKKIKTSPVQTDWTTAIVIDIQIIHRLFWNCLLWDADAAFLTMRQSRDKLKVVLMRDWLWRIWLWDKSEMQRSSLKESYSMHAYNRLTEAKGSRQGCLWNRWKRLWQCVVRQANWSLILWSMFSKKIKFKKKMNNSKQTSDRLVKTGKATALVWLA